MTDCRHFWEIEPSNGRFSLGVCRYCGEEKEFQNSSDAQAMAGVKKKGRGKAITVKSEAGEATGGVIFLVAIMAVIFLIGIGKCQAALG